MYVNSKNIYDFFNKSQQLPPVRQLGITHKKLVNSRVNCVKTVINQGKYSDTKQLFSFSNRCRRIGLFVLTLRRVNCPQNTVYYELILESVKRGPQIEVFSFFIGPSFKDPTAGDPMFVVSLKEITDIMSELRFDADVFLRIARAIVPPEYVVVMHHEQHLCEDDEQKQRLFNPFSIPVDLFSLQARPEKRQRSCVPTIENFSSKPAVEVVEEKTNKNLSEKLSKRRRC